MSGDCFFFKVSANANLHLLPDLIFVAKPYEEVADLEHLQERMVQSLNEYNARSRKPMDLVMFMFAVEHVSRLAR